MGNVETVGPNELLVISGGNSSRKYITAGWGWASIGSKTQRMSLEMIVLTPTCRKVQTKDGGVVTVTGAGNFKVFMEPELLKRACENFMDKSREEVEKALLETFEGHLRTVMSTESLESLVQDRREFAQLVREKAAPDIARMGFEIVSFTITDVKEEPKR